MLSNIISVRLSPSLRIEVKFAMLGQTRSAISCRVDSQFDRRFFVARSAAGWRRGQPLSPEQRLGCGLRCGLAGLGQNGSSATAASTHAVPIVLLGALGVLNDRRDREAAAR